jgi:adenylosuccinate lyase
LTLEEIKAELDPSLYIGRSASQVDAFLKEVAQPIITKWHEGEIQAELKV